uniref:Uncharacterized protein n=1 Tax=viral metagenome TaxID=1070528 RepID=A0A6C0AE55_9ZZZZ
MEELNIAKQIKVFKKICECGQRIGYVQKEYEEYLINEQSKILDLTDDDRRNIELQAIDYFFGKRMCCRNTFWNSRMPFIKDSNRGAFKDLANLLTENTISKTITIKNGVKFIPIVDPPEFPDYVPLLKVEPELDFIPRR